MEKTSNIILALLFVLIIACICVPIIFVSGTVSKICIFIGIVAMVALSGFSNYVLWSSNKNDERDF